jgi:hypothetical protein
MTFRIDNPNFDINKYQKFIQPTTGVGIRDWLYERYKSGEWWIIAAPALQAADIGEVIEHRYYDPKDKEKNKDFELTLLLNEAVAFIACKKTRMTCEQFKESLKVIAFSNRKTVDTLTPENRLFVYSASKDFAPDNPNLRMAHEVGTRNMLQWVYHIIQYFKSMGEEV